MVISYPRCGGVWVAQIVYLLLNDCVPLADANAFDQQMPNLEEYGYLMPRERNAADEVRIVRSHLPYHKMRINPMAKYIYVTRNPKDCCVAMYHYITHVSIFRFKEGTWDNFFEWFIRGRICYNDYFDHIIHYWVHRKDCHVLFLTYENMTLDHKSHIFMLANFIGGVAGTMVKDRHMLKKLIHRSSYSYMSQFFKDEAHLGNLTKGRIGEWKTMFSPAQATRLDRKFYERFGSSDIANLWRYIVRFDRPA
ncbi:sulfotransferase ssu-1-like [Amblyomma americanum]